MRSHNRQRVEGEPDMARQRLALAANHYHLAPDSDEGEPGAPFRNRRLQHRPLLAGQADFTSHACQPPGPSSFLLKDCLASIILTYAEKSACSESLPPLLGNPTLTCAMCDGTAQCTGSTGPRSATMRKSKRRTTVIPSTKEDETPTTLLSSMAK